MVGQEASDSLPATKYAEKNELGYVGGNGPEAGQEITVEQEGLKEKNLSSQKSWES